MPFNARTIMEQKLEFVLLAQQGKISFQGLCKRYSISRKTGYKWVSRYKEHGEDGLLDQSRKPKTSPTKTKKVIEERILALRASVNGEWGSKKIQKLLENEYEGCTEKVPARSTINSILKRNGCIQEEKSRSAKAWTRFEHESPNDLWQMDFKGHFALLNNKRCHPLTITDDHSRFNIGLFACPDEKGKTVQERLVDAFNLYGMPKAILTDNGSPWGVMGRLSEDGQKTFSSIEKWFIQLQIDVIHGKPYHPQTQGKEERFHRTLKAELLQYESFQDYRHCQERFNWWRDRYNCYRPHEAIDMLTPIKKYQPSTRVYKEKIDPPYYENLKNVRKVHDGGFISFRNKEFRVGKAFTGEYVEVKPTLKNGTYDVLYYDKPIRRIKLT